MLRCIKYVLVIFIFNACVSTKSYVKYENPEDLYPIGNEGLWGFVDSIGNIKIPTIFEETRFFSHGLAVAKLNGKYGYINEAGEWKIKPQYDEAGSFYFGCADVILDGVQTYIRRNSKVNNNCELWNFVSGCLVPQPPHDPKAFTVRKGDKFALTYKTVRDTTEYLYDSVRRFNREFILVFIDDKWGFHYINNNRSVWGDVELRLGVYDEIKTTYELWNDEIEDGNIRYAEVKNNERWGLINTFTLQEISVPKYLSMDRSQDKKFILVEIEPNYFGYIDYEGKEYFKRR